jgi:hypothetical protein
VPRLPAGQFEGKHLLHCQLVVPHIRHPSGRDSRLRREYDMYLRLGAVAPPGADTAARRCGLPLVHACGAARAGGPA